MEVIVENPEEFYKEVEGLIHLHYHQTPRRGFDVTKSGFAVSYPNIYRIFLRITALGLRDKGKQHSKSE